MIGNVICLPKSGSTFLHTILPDSVHEFDHKDISLLSLDSQEEGFSSLAGYYLYSRSQVLSRKIDIATSKIFLVPFLPPDECLLPTIFLVRDPNHWSRSILSYSLDVARAGQFHEWVRFFQSRFVGDLLLSESDLFDSTSLSRFFPAIQPKLLDLWCSVHQTLLDHLSKFPHFLFLTTNQLSQSAPQAFEFFHPFLPYVVPDAPLLPVNKSTPSTTINNLVATYFRDVPELPSVIDASLLQNYILSLRNFSFL